MPARDDLIGRLAALIDQHSPRRVIVVVRHAVTARWLASLLAERGVVVGARFLDLEGLLRGAALELAGEPVAPLRSLALVRRALLEDPRERFAAIADQPSYQREVLRCFVELERSIEGESALLSSTLASCRADSRDRAMLEAFERFRLAMQAEPWWSGQSLALLLAGHRRVSFLRRRAAAVGIGFPEATLARWERRLLDALGVERWDAGAPSSARAPLDLRLSCAGPEAEIAAVARLLRADPQLPSVVLAPAESIPRWAARLGHRDVPVRAWVDRRASDTAPARTVRALLRMLAAPTQVRREDLEAVLFGPALRGWAVSSEALELDYPRDPNPGELREVWDQQRASSFSLATLAERITKAAQRAQAALDERARRNAWSYAARSEGPRAASLGLSAEGGVAETGSTPGTAAFRLLALDENPGARRHEGLHYGLLDQLERRRERVAHAHALVAATIGRLAALADGWEPASLRTLLDDWDLLGRAAVHGVESAPMGAARVILDLLGKTAATTSTDELAGNLDHALARASVGSWEQTRSIDGGPAVWLLPYAVAAELGAVSARVILTGLDRHPASPIHHGPVSESLRASLGLVADAARFTFELRELDGVVARSGAQTAASQRPVVGSWRHRDGSGNRRPPGPWIAARQDEGIEQLVGVDVIAVPPREPEGIRPTSPHERALLDWAASPLMRRRVEAIRSHDSPELGPHTGELGVAVPADRPYSASSLQSYAALPYRYFVDRVIGLRERERPAESASALLATEQGQVVHRALETALAARLAQTEGALELASIADELFAELLEALAIGYRGRAEHGQAEAIWANERDRWAMELGIWWQHWRARMVGDWANPSRRKPEPEVLVPSPFLLATEWSVNVGDEPFELDLGLRTIPFVGSVDRIEIDPKRQRLNICDYKTGRPSWPAGLAAQLRAGVHLQLPLYALAVAQVVACAPERLRLSGPVKVGALRLEYLQRPRPSAPGRPVVPQARGFSPDSPLGVDEGGQTWTISQAAAGFTLAFVTAIEAGRFAVVARAPGFGRARSDRLHELARVVPGPDQRKAGLPPALRPLADPRLAKEAVQ